MKELFTWSIDNEGSAPVTSDAPVKVSSGPRVIDHGTGLNAPGGCADAKLVVSPPGGRSKVGSGRKSVSSVPNTLVMGTAVRIR